MADTASYNRVEQRPGIAGPDNALKAEFRTAGGPLRVLETASRSIIMMAGSLLGYR